MLPPARFPTSEAELAEWSVYADWLMTRGDRRGESMALELALPAAPDRQSLDRFLEASRRLHRERRTSPIAWCLGHVRTLSLPPDQIKLGSMIAPDHGTLANVTQLLQTDVASHLEAIELTYGTRHDQKWSRRLFAALPATCSRVTIGLVNNPDIEDIEALLSFIPRTVRELFVYAVRGGGRMVGPNVIAALVTDRFDLVGVGNIIAGPQHGEALATALASTRTVVVQITDLDDTTPRVPRVQLGGPDDAALVAPGAARAHVLPRWEWLALQRRFGPVPVRAQIARQLPEDHGLHLTYEGDRVVAGQGSDLVRRGDTWTLRGADIIDDPRRIYSRIAKNGEQLNSAQIVPLADGDRIGVGNAEAVFVASARSAFALDSQR